MALKYDHHTFMENVARRLLSKGWREVGDYPEKFELVASREETKAVVKTRRIIAFLQGDNLSREEMIKAVEKAHNLMKEKAKAPLFPATSILVFVFEKANDANWILEKGKNRDVLRSSFTVSWIVDLSKRELKKHKGFPIIDSGKSEINEALNSFL